MKIFRIFCFILFFIHSCTKNKYEAKFIPVESDYYAQVSINGTSVRNWIRTSAVRFNSDSLLEFNMSFSSYDYDRGVFHNISFLNIPRSSGNFTLQGNITRTNYCDFVELCCEAMPDQINFRYVIFEPDSFSNQIILNVDTSTSLVFGHFQATLINAVSPFNLLYLDCDSFSVHLEQ